MRFALRGPLVLAAAGFLFNACAPQARNNPLDPDGSAYAPMLVGFTSQNLALTPPTTPWDKNIGIGWPAASNVSKYRIYLSTNSVRPAIPTLDNLASTNTNAALSGAGTNHIWVEAVGTGSNTPSVFLQTNHYVRSGWSIDPNERGLTNPCLRCVNVPAGQTRVISFPKNINAGSIATSGSQIKSVGAANLDIQFGFTNAASPGVYFGWTNANVNSPNFGYIAGPNSGPSFTAGLGDFKIIVKNNSPSEGFNAVWIDDISVTGGVSINETFTNMADSNLSGEKEK